MCPYFEDDDDPKKPRPIRQQRKGSEECKDDERDRHRHVIVRC